MPRGNPPQSQRAGLSPAWLCALCGQQARTASVELSKAPDVCAQDIADHTLALLRAATRQIVQDHESVRQGRAPKGDVPYRWRDGVPERAAEVDFLVVCASGGPATRGLIDAEVLQALGPQGVLVNVGRGSVVDEAALQQALQERTIAAAALDVFAHEPQVSDALIELPNTVLTPHMASSTLQGLQDMFVQAEAYLLEHFGLEPHTG